MKLVREYLYEKFTEKSDPIQDMNIGIKRSIDKWFQENGFSHIKYWQLSDNGLIEGFYNLNLDYITNFPEYINFGTISGDFSIINSEEFTSLRGIPEVVEGDFIFYNNGITPTEEEIRKLCDVKGYVILEDKNEFIHKLRKEKYKKLGNIKDRPSPKVDYEKRHVEQQYSRGYMLWKLLEFIENKKSQGGAKYSEIVKFYYTTFMGQYYRRTPSSGVYNSIMRYTDRILRLNTGKYFLNHSGERYLIKYKDAFEK